MPQIFVMNRAGVLVVLDKAGLRFLTGVDTLPLAGVKAGDGTLPLASASRRIFCWSGGVGTKKRAWRGEASGGARGEASGAASAFSERRLSRLGELNATSSFCSQPRFDSWKAATIPSVRATAR